MAKKGIIGTVTEGFAESTHNVHAANKENMAANKNPPAKPGVFATNTNGVV